MFKYLKMVRYQVGERVLEYNLKQVIHIERVMVSDENGYKVLALEVYYLDKEPCNGR